MGRSSQRKGRGGELELSRILREAGFPVSPGLAVSFGDTPDLVGLPGVHIECKRVEKLNLRTAMEQAVRDASFFKDGAPAVFHRQNRQPWLVTMRLEDWLNLYQRGGGDHDGEAEKICGGVPDRSERDQSIPDGVSGGEA